MLETNTVLELLVRLVYITSRIAQLILSIKIMFMVLDEGDK